MSGSKALLLSYHGGYKSVSLSSAGKKGPGLKVKMQQAPQVDIKDIV